MLDMEKVRRDLEAAHGQVWDYHELRRDFDVVRIEADRAIVIRKQDRCRGLVRFASQPTLYYGFEPHESD